MYRNWKLWATLGVVAAAIVVLTPISLATALPLMLVAACPLSMLLMAGTMAHGARRSDTAPDTDVASDSKDRVA